MCGRTRCTLRPDDFPRACHLNGRPVRHINTDRYRPSNNVSPGFNIPVVRRDDVSNGDGQGQVQEQGVVLQCMKWGLIPSFMKKTEKPDHYKMFNARSESIREKVSFNRLIPKNRCLVAVEGFYEWKKDGSKKQPYYIHFKDGRPLVFAALFDLWKNAEGESIYTFTIVTTSSSSSLKWLHDRMPVIFGNKESSDLWLNGSPTSNFDLLFKPYEDSDLAWYPVTPAMGKPSFDGPECIKEIPLKTEESKPISHFFTKKGVKNQREDETENKPTKTSLKEEDQTLDSTNINKHDQINPPERKKGKLTHDGDTNISIKQEYKEDTKPIEPIQSLSNNTKHTFDQASSKKNKITTSTNDKQPTLLSFFKKN